MPIGQAGIAKFGIAIDLFRYRCGNPGNAFGDQIICRRYHIALRNNHSYICSTNQSEQYLDESLHIRLQLITESTSVEAEPNGGGDAAARIHFLFALCAYRLARSL